MSYFDYELGNFLIAIAIGAQVSGSVEEEGYANVEFDLFGCEAMADLFADVEDDADAQHHFSPIEMEFNDSWDWLIPAARALEVTINVTALSLTQVYKAVYQTAVDKALIVLVSHFDSCMHKFI